MGKHGRVAMAAFVGYWIQSNYVFTWPQSLAGGMPPSADLQPEEQWDLVNSNAKWQIITVIGFLEIWDNLESTLPSRNSVKESTGSLTFTIPSSSTEKCRMKSANDACWSKSTTDVLP